MVKIVLDSYFQRKSYFILKFKNVVKSHVHIIKPYINSVSCRVTILDYFIIVYRSPNHLSALSDYFNTP